MKKQKRYDIRIGFGFDIHRLIEGRKLIIAGIEIKHNKGMLGHSDGDVVIHAICDGLLGSIGEGEIGIYFPPTDLTIMGISSKEIAKRVLKILENKKAVINQMDITIVGEEPKLKPFYNEMRKSLAKIFNIDIKDINIKAKTMEGIGEVGKGEAIICYAVCTVKKYT